MAKMPPVADFKDAWIKVNGRWFFSPNIPRLHKDANGREYVVINLYSEGNGVLYPTNLYWHDIQGMRH